LVAGELDAMFANGSVAGPNLASNRVRALMFSSARRSPAFPNIPTATEAGLVDFVVDSWIGLFGPKNLPRDIIQRANEAVNQACADQQVRARVARGGDELGGGTPERLERLARDDHKRWGDVVRANHITADE
jgi:tripartite-type tricarboxylate transporter receptor subunit TctC